jgi:hypothetical protein
MHDGMKAPKTAMVLDTASVQAFEDLQGTNVYHLIRGGFMPPFFRFGCPLRTNSLQPAITPHRTRVLAALRFQFGALTTRSVLKRNVDSVLMPPTQSTMLNLQDGYTPSARTRSSVRTHIGNVVFMRRECGQFPKS